MTHPKVYIIILNWNGWQDTIECLESVFRNNYPVYTVIVCDNGSRDGSLEKIKLWAEGKLDVLVPSHNLLRILSYPPVAKPIPYVEYNREDAEKGGLNDGGMPLVLIETEGNLGFAGGNNVGLRYILAKGDADYVWLLNNDTIIRPDALNLLIAKAKSDPQAGCIGSAILLYSNTDIIDAAGGGMIMKYLAGCYHVMHRKSYNDLRKEMGVIKLDYITGASCFLPLTCLRNVGLLDETYFHFWEDVDLGFRIAKLGYKNIYEPGSVVYHKVGASTGGKSPFADYYELRGAVLFYRKHFNPCFLITIFLKIGLKVLNRIRRNQIDRIPILLKAFYHGMSIQQ